MFGLVLGAISTALSLKGASDASKAGKRQARQEAYATNEKIRRLEIQKDATIGAQKAGAAAAGVAVTSKSVLDITRETIEEIELEKKFVRQAGAFAAQSAELRGKTAAYQQLTGALTGASQIFSIVQSNRNPPPSPV